MPYVEAMKRSFVVLVMHQQTRKACLLVPGKDLRRHSAEESGASKPFAETMQGIVKDLKALNLEP